MKKCLFNKNIELSFFLIKAHDRLDELDYNPQFHPMISRLSYGVVIVV